MQDILAKTSRAFLKPIEQYLADDSVAEIMVNGAAEVYIERAGKLERTESVFRDEEQLMAAVRNIAQYVGRNIDEDNPVLDARLADGSRIHAVIPPCARRGIYLTIRKFSRSQLSMKDLIKMGTLHQDGGKFLNLCVAMAKNIVVAGGTSSGKTTLLNVVSGLIPEDQRIVVIEDASELQLQQPHVVPLETKSGQTQKLTAVTIRDLLKASLRMRPDRIVIGEVRGGEALDLLQAMNTGHSGSMSTVHANDPPAALKRLETLALMSGIDIPLTAVRAQVASAIEIIVQVSRMRDGNRRITHISEVVGLDANGEYQLSDIFVYEIESVGKGGNIRGSHRATGIKPSFLEESRRQGYKIKAQMFES